MSGWAITTVLPPMILGTFEGNVMITLRCLVWTYRGFNVYPCTGVNGSGLRWYAHTGAGFLRSETKGGMRELIRAWLKSRRVCA